MDSGFESAFRAMLKAVVLEVVESLSSRPSRSGAQPREEIAQPGVLLVRPKDAAKALAISEGQLAKLTRFGKLPCVRINRSVRYDVAVLQDWITLDDSARELEPPPARKVGAAKSDVGRKLKKPRRRSAPRAVVRSGNEQPGVTPREVVQPKPPKKDDEKVGPRDVRGLIARRLGVSRNKLPVLTNGELMAAAEVDLVTYHGWVYLDREMPEAAISRLEKHYAGMLTQVE